MANSERKKAQNREWARRNREKVKASEKAFWERKTAELQKEQPGITMAEVKRAYKKASASKEASRKWRETYWNKKAAELQKEHPEIVTGKDARNFLRKCKLEQEAKQDKAE